MDGPSIIPTPTKDGVAVIQNTDIYQLVCTKTACQWLEKPRKLKYPRQNFVALYIPDSLAKCSK